MVEFRTQSCVVEGCPLPANYSGGFCSRHRWTLFRLFRVEGFKCDSCGHIVRMAGTGARVWTWVCPLCASSMRHGYFARRRSTSIREPIQAARAIESNASDTQLVAMKSVPESIRQGLLDAFGPAGALLRLLPAQGRQAACLFIVFPREHFRTTLTDRTRVRLRFPVTDTPLGVPVISSCLQIFDSNAPGIDEHFHRRDRHLSGMADLDAIYLFISDPSYAIYFSRKLSISGALKQDMAAIRNAFAKYGEESEAGTLGDPGAITALRAIEWYQSRTTMKDLIDKYFP